MTKLYNRLNNIEFSHFLRIALLDKQKSPGLNLVLIPPLITNQITIEINISTFKISQLELNFGLISL